MTEVPRPAALRLRRLLLASASALAALGIAEAGFRVRAHLRNSNTLERALAAPQVFSAGDNQAALADLIVPSVNDRIAYELRPNLPGVLFKGQPVTTNSAGFRSAEMPVAEPANTRTVVGIGDSIQFGHGVADGETYLDVLEDRLQEQYPETSWRTVNTGVPGYNTVMEVETLVAKGLAYSPDLVVLGLCGNDYSPPKYVRAPDDVFDLRRSFLLEFAAESLAGEGHEGSEAAPGLSHRGHWSEASGQKVPERYAGLHGKEAFAGALDRLAELSEEHGFPVVALAFHHVFPTRHMMDACRERGFHVISAQKFITQETERQVGAPFTWPKLLESDLVVSPDNGHPSAKMHRVLAGKVMTIIRSNRLLR